MADAVSHDCFIGSEYSIRTNSAALIEAAIGEVYALKSDGVWIGSHVARNLAQDQIVADEPRQH